MSDPNQLRTWSNEQLNAWLKSSLEAERQTTMNIISTGLAEMLDQMNERINSLESELAELKKPKKGFWK